MTIPSFILPLGMIGYPQLIIIVAIILLLFGGKKIPELMRGMGRGVKEFKDAVGKDYSTEEGQQTVDSNPEATGPAAEKSTSKKAVSK